ncbi:uncharacterized protein LOC101858066 [Aplysia californica]|uniref:Uncharacterized protein LOC101858066 n=1 Tax=Aplysia californica TaxID=6500 RepID=A0ABM0K513_APLCA|nr:uncharacterized protein LOC101858066 [Aplysia californica]
MTSALHYAPPLYACSWDCQISQHNYVKVDVQLLLFSEVELSDRKGQLAYKKRGFHNWRLIEGTSQTSCLTKKAICAVVQHYSVRGSFLDTHDNMAGTLKPLSIAGFIVLGLGLLLHLVGLATPEWILMRIMPGRTEGLFQGCLGNGECVELTYIPSNIKAVRAMVILGLILGAVGSACALMHLICSFMSRETKAVVPLVVMGTCLAAFSFIIIGVIVYAADYYGVLRKSFDLGYSFALCVVGGILLASGGALFFLGERKDSSE